MLVRSSHSSRLSTMTTGSCAGRAAEALGQLGDARAVEPLIAALNDDNRAVRQRRLRTGNNRRQEALMALETDGVALS